METKDKQISVKIPAWLYDMITNESKLLDRSRAWITRDVLCRVYKQELLLPGVLPPLLENDLPAHK